MAVDEIQALQVKPDLKKAMLFVKQFGDQPKSVHTAELIADRMNMKVETNPSPMGSIYEYRGPQIQVPIITPGRSQHYWQVAHEVFWTDGERIWLNHSWCMPTSDLWSYSRKLCDGVLNSYNQVLYNHMNQKHAA